MLVRLLVSIIMISFCNDVWSVPSLSLSGDDILKKVDSHRFYNTSYMTGKMVIKSRVLRTKTLKSWQKGEETSFIEFTNPLDDGTKMLKVKNQLWLYFPDAEEVIKLSGHLLREGLMGSDFSYEDMMDNQQLLDDYKVTRLDDQIINKISHFVLLLTAKHKHISYAQRRLWVDKKVFTIKKMSLYSVSGEKLKEMFLSDYRRIDDHYVPFKMHIKDLFKKDSYTDFIIDELKLNPKINPSRFTKAALYDDL